jgi:hypothetical protein
MTTAKRIDYQGFELTSEDESKSITFTMDGTNKGIRLGFDLLSANPKTFTITPNGVNFVDNTFNQTTPLLNLCALQTVLSAVDIPPNSTTLKLVNSLLLDNGTGDTLTATNSNLVIDNSANSGPTNTSTSGDITINDFGSTAVSQLTSDFIQVRDGGNTVSSLMSKNALHMVDSSSLLEVEVNNDFTATSEPYIRMKNSSGLNNYYNRNSINADGHNCFTLNNNERFFKQNNPFSFLTYKLNDGDYIERSYPFVYCYNLSVIKLYNPADYLDDSGNDGWSCIVSNHNGVDMQIDTAGYDWYSHSNGLVGNPIQLKKYATCRITLINSTGYGNYIWAVSQF